MNRPRTRAAADLAASLKMRLPALASLLLLAASLIAFLPASGRAQAAPAACNGSDLLAGLDKTDPALAERIRREAAATRNGEGLLWRIEGRGGPEMQQKLTKGTKQVHCFVLLAAFCSNAVLQTAG